MVNLILDGQERQDSVDDIFGDDKHAFMDQVMASAPHMTKKEKTLGNLHLGLMIIVIFMLIYLGRDSLKYLLGQFMIHKEVTAAVQITVLDLLMPILIAFLAINFINAMINSTYLLTKNAQKVQIIFYGICTFILIAFSPLLEIIIKIPAVKSPFGIYLILTAIGYAIYKSMEKYLDKKYNREI